MAKRRSRKRAIPASAKNRKIFREGPRKKFGDVCRVLWPSNTASSLAGRADVTVRMAEYYIEGRSAPSARAIHAIVGEILD